MSQPAQPPPGAVQLTDLTSPRGRRRLATGRAVRYLLILGYAVVVAAYLPVEIRHAVRNHWSVGAILLNTVFALACVTVILVGALKVMRPTMSRLVLGVHSWIEGTELVAEGGVRGRVDLASCEARLGTATGDGATVTPSRVSAPVLLLGPDREGRHLAYPLGEPTIGSLRPAGDLDTLARYLAAGATESARRTATELARLAARPPR
ncbi:hypothetical protein [Actinocatenispora comari]|uniref:Uncharacterized protein n=1 Tax=Actinocatenispora comari TaxID=2807577 RepID=A0A8J4ELM0_9ACTN|nr:hypothetical protein [Actinocatenispora comari]GIL29407.1 hypothetical protein NUM_46610 [Actinocatenispora comari]